MHFCLQTATFSKVCVPYIKLGVMWYFELPAIVIGKTNEKIRNPLYLMQITVEFQMYYWLGFNFPW